MSDEEELSRMAESIVGSEGIGEELLIALPDEESLQQDLEDLGLIDG